jgi:thiol-disulfide isomerase/thioredoxin
MRFMTVFSTLISFFIAGHTCAWTLEIGDTAPSLSTVTWVKGTPVTPKDTVTVVEFWATWCAPCITTIPHLTKLQKQFGSNVQIAGLSNEDAAKVQPFVEKMGDKMDYHIGLADEATHRAYMDGVAGIPYAFIVDKSGIVVWSGHPGSMDTPLAQIIAGTFDREKAKKIAAAETRLEDILNTRQPDIKAALATIDQLLSLDPYHQQAISIRIAIGKHQVNPALIRETLTQVPLSGLTADFANKLAFTQMSEDNFVLRQLDLAAPLIEHALKLEPNNAGYLDTQARYFYTLGQIDRAIATQEKAIAIEPSDKELAESLRYYHTVKALANGAPLPQLPATSGTINHVP